MILQLNPDAPLWMRAAADLALVLHIGGASLALVSGPAAMIARKGGRLHKLTGEVFAVSMLVMTGVGAVVAALFPTPDLMSVMGGSFAFYLTATSWTTVRRKSAGAGAIEGGAVVFAIGVAVAAVVIANMIRKNPFGLGDGQPYQVLYVFTVLALLGAGGDLSVVLRKGVTGASRVARHLWRMCLALLMAFGSFAAQPKAQPEFLRGSQLLMLPVLIILLAMIYWLVRVRLPRRTLMKAAAA
jgi:hypothetical protein